MLKKALFVFVGVALGPLWLAADDWKVSIREWDVPTPKSRPHDPEVTPDAPTGSPRIKKATSGSQLISRRISVSSIHARAK